MRRSRISLFLLPSLLPSTYASTPHFLLPRQLQNCTDASSTLCQIPNASFCCPSNTDCIPLENATSVICCAKNTNCDVIQPISCTDPPESAVTCGSQCCPRGFTCGPNADRCIMKSENRPSSYPTHTATPTATPTASSSPSPLSEQCQALLSTPSCPGFPAKAIVTGFFPGMALGIAVVLMFNKAREVRTRRRTIQFNDRLSATVSPTTPTVAMTQSINGPSYRSWRTDSEWTPPGIMVGETWKKTEIRSQRDFSPNLGPPVGPLRRVESRREVQSVRPQSEAISCITDGEDGESVWEREREIGKVLPLRVGSDRFTRRGYGERI